jgi:Haem-binding domain
VRRRRRIVVAAGILLLAMQAFPIARTNPPVGTEITAPDDVRLLLRRACYDCHSHETVWPWYSRVAPVSWLIAHDVGEGRRELDFSTWDAYDPVKRRKKLRESAEEVAERAMPPWYYAIVHPAARLTADERARLEDWTLVCGR